MLEHQLLGLWNRCLDQAPWILTVILVQPLSSPFLLSFSCNHSAPPSYYHSHATTQLPFLLSFSCNHSAPPSYYHSHATTQLPLLTVILMQPLSSPFLLSFSCNHSAPPRTQISSMWSFTWKRPAFCSHTPLHLVSTNTSEKCTWNWNMRFVHWGKLKIQIAVFWFLALRDVVHGYWDSRGNWRLQVQDKVT
jgi:hypothetical protein